MLLARRILKLDFMTYNLYNENRFLITALNNHIKSLEKQLDEKQVVIETLILQKVFTKIYKTFLTTTLLLLATINLIKFF